MAVDLAKGGASDPDGTAGLPTGTRFQKQRGGISRRRPGSRGKAPSRSAKARLSRRGKDEAVAWVTKAPKPTDDEIKKLAKEAHNKK